MPVRRILALPAAVVLASGGVAACGGSGGAPPATRPPALTRAQALVAQSAAASAQVHSYHAAGVSIDATGRNLLTADVSDDGRLRVTTTTRDGTLSLIVVGTATYVKADRRFWLGNGGSRARQAADALAGHWVKTPPSFGTPFLTTVKELLPKTLAHCLPLKLGTLSVAGTRTYGGRRVTVVRDDGNTPGGTPGEIWLATTGPALPLRELTHGATRRGGTFDALCDQPNDTTTRSSYQFSMYDTIAPIHAPRHALDLGRLRRRGGAAGGLSA